jgi:hypothetical protein
MMAQAPDPAAPAPETETPTPARRLHWPSKLVIASVGGGLLLGLLLASSVAVYFQRQVRTALQKEIGELRVALNDSKQRLAAQDAVVLGLNGQIGALQDFIQASFAGDSISGMVPRTPEEMCQQLKARCAAPAPTKAGAAAVAPEPAKPKDDCVFDGRGTAEEKAAAMIRCVARLDPPRKAGSRPASPARNTPGQGK